MRSKFYQLGYESQEALLYVNWFFSMEALVRLPPSNLKRYKPDPTLNRERGEAFRIGEDKWLVQNNGRIELDKPPNINPLCKLFRDKRRYDSKGNRRDWVREEYCLRGFERYEENDDPKRAGWYEVIVDNVDDATRPSQAPQNWKRKEDDK